MALTIQATQEPDHRRLASVAEITKKQKSFSWQRHLVDDRFQKTHLHVKRIWLEPLLSKSTISGKRNDGKSIYYYLENSGLAVVGMSCDMRPFTVHASTETPSLGRTHGQSFIVYRISLNWHALIWPSENLFKALFGAPWNRHCQSVRSICFLDLSKRLSTEVPAPHSLKGAPQSRLSLSIFHLSNSILRYWISHRLKTFSLFSSDFYLRRVWFYANTDVCHPFFRTVFFNFITYITFTFTG